MLNQQAQGQGQQTLSQSSTQMLQQSTIVQNINSSVGKLNDSHGLSSIGKLKFLLFNTLSLLQLSSGILKGGVLTEEKSLQTTFDYKILLFFSS